MFNITRHHPPAAALDLEPVQAVMFDLASRRFFIFDLVVYPQKPSFYDMLANPFGTSVAAGLTLFEVEYADRDGNSLSGRDRYRSLQISQVFLKGSPGVALLFDEVEDVFPPISTEAAQLIARLDDDRFVALLDARTDGVKTAVTPSASRATVPAAPGSRTLATFTVDAYPDALRVIDRSASALKPPNTTLCTAPMRAQASIATTASGIALPEAATSQLNAASAPWPSAARVMPQSCRGSTITSNLNSTHSVPRSRTPSSGSATSEPSQESP